MRSDVLGRYPGVTHDRDAGTDLFVHARAFERLREGVVRTKLVTDLMHDIVDVETVPFRDRVGGRSDAAALVVVRAAHAADAAGVSAAARGTEHVPDVIHRGSDVGVRYRIPQLV